jgi:hypothetical protein
MVPVVVTDAAGLDPVNTPAPAATTAKIASRELPLIPLGY